MSRIFDALKKADAARQAAPLGGAPVTPMPAALPHASGARPAPVARTTVEAFRSPLPLLGQIPLGDDTVREMTALRVSVESVLTGTPRTILFVSPQGGEGTSTVTLQFAEVLARDPNVRPLLIDGNLRRPVYTADASQRMAMLDARLQRGATAPAAVASNLFAVPPSDELLRSGVFQPATMRQVLDTCSPGFDWVLVDGPPVLESPDSAPLASQVDGVILVVQAGRTKRPVLTRAADLLRKAGARVLGSVLNRRVLEIPEFIYRRI